MEITMENFSPENRDRIIGNSLYRVCRNERGLWYISEHYSTFDTWAWRHGYFSRDLKKVLAKLNSFRKELEIVEGGGDWE